MMGEHGRELLKVHHLIMLRMNHGMNQHILFRFHQHLISGHQVPGWIQADMVTGL